MLLIDFNISTTRGLTLSELLISMVIVSFMMIGILTTDHAIRSMNNKVTDDITLSMQIRSVAEHIRRDAMLSTGELADPGIDLAIANSVCFRRDDDANPSPGDYSDDIWTCYTLLVNDLYKCSSASGAAPAACTAADIFVGRLVANNLSSATFNNGQFHILLQTRKDPAVAQDNNTNPQAETEIAVYPIGYSSQ
jgi:hypothetical protein